MGHLCGEVGRHVPVLPTHAITYITSSPHAYQIYNPFTYKIVKTFLYMYIQHALHIYAKAEIQLFILEILLLYCTNKVVCNLILARYVVRATIRDTEKCFLEADWLKTTAVLSAVSQFSLVSVLPVLRKLIIIQKTRDHCWFSVAH